MKQLVLVASSLPLPHPRFQMLFSPLLYFCWSRCFIFWSRCFTFWTQCFFWSRCFTFLVLVASSVPLPHPMFLMLYCWLFSPGHPLPLPQCHIHSFVHSSTRPSYHKVPFWICDPWQVHFGYVSPLIFLKLANAGQILTQNAITVFSTIFSFIHPCFELLCFFTFFDASFVNEGW